MMYAGGGCDEANAGPVFDIAAVWFTPANAVAAGTGTWSKVSGQPGRWYSAYEMNAPIRTLLYLPMAPMC